MANTETKELNLVQITRITFNWINNFSKKTIQFLGKLLQLSVKHWVIFLLFVALGITGGIFLSQKSKLKYKAGTTLYVSYSKTFLVKEIIDNLKSSIKKHKDFSLATRLNIPDTVAHNILNIQYFNIIDYGRDYSQDLIDFKDKHSLTDTANIIMNDRMYIQIKTKNPSQVPIFEKALLDYLNSNPRLIHEFEALKKGHEERVEFSIKEINRLDSLANISYFKESSYNMFNLDKNTLMLGQQKKPLFYDDILNLIGVKEYSQRYLYVAKTPVYITDGFAIEGPINSRIKMLIYGLLIGVLVGFIASYIFEHLKIIIKYLLNKQDINP